MLPAFHLFLGERLDSYIETSMSIERSGAHDDKFILFSRPRSSIKYGRVRIIQHCGAFLLLHRARGKDFLPDMIGDDHMIGKCNRGFFDQCQRLEYG